MNFSYPQQQSYGFIIPHYEYILQMLNVGII